MNAGIVSISCAVILAVLLILRPDLGYKADFYGINHEKLITTLQGEDRIQTSLDSLEAGQGLRSPTLPEIYMGEDS
jgi:hypothetical protein